MNNIVCHREDLNEEGLCSPIMYEATKKECYLPAEWAKDVFIELPSEDLDPEEDSEDPEYNIRLRHEPSGTIILAKTIDFEWWPENSQIAFEYMVQNFAEDNNRKPYEVLTAFACFMKHDPTPILDLMKELYQPAVRYAINRAPNGISLNGKEYVLDDDGEVKLFGSEKDAKQFLLKNGANPDYIGDGIYIEPYGD